MVDSVASIASIASIARILGLRLLSIFKDWRVEIDWSKVCRGLMIPKLEAFFELVVGLNSPLPPPKNAARTLHKRALELIEQWNRDFGQHYRQGSCQRFTLQTVAIESDLNPKPSVRLPVCSLSSGVAS
eukprot:1192441-Prorocentrum_minimum.AAC.6